MRYLIEVYAPFSLLAAIGFLKMIDKLPNKAWLKTGVIILLSFYIFIDLFKISPYYLDYFNVHVGGTKNVYEHNLFDLGWWGEGGGEAGDYLITHAPRHSLIGYQLNPFSALRTTPSLQYEQFDKTKQYDYVVTNYYFYQKVSYNRIDLQRESEVIRNEYTLIYEVLADGAPLYKVYKN